MVVSFSPSFIVVVVCVVPPLSRWSSLGECPSLLSLHDDDNGRPSRTSTYVAAAAAAASHQHEGDETRGEAAVCGCGYDSENKNSMAVRGGREGDARHPWQTIFVVGHSLARSVGRSLKGEQNTSICHYLHTTRKSGSGSGSGWGILRR